MQPTSNKHGCNCINRAECPLDNKCLTSNILYKTVISAPSNPDKKYFGIAETQLQIVSKSTQEIATKVMLNMRGN